MNNLLSIGTEGEGGNREGGSTQMHFVVNVPARGDLITLVSRDLFYSLGGEASEAPTPFLWRFALFLRARKLFRDP